MLTKNLSKQEAVASQTAKRLGIKNEPTPEIWEVMKITAENVFQPIRDHFKKPIRVSSFYRSPALNKAIGGSKTSDHMTGRSIDIQGTNGITNKMIFEFAKNNLDFDQLINEYPDKYGEPSWVHISYRGPGKNRKQVLTIGKR